MNNGETFQELVSTSATPYLIAQNMFTLRKDKEMRKYLVNKMKDNLYSLVPMLYSKDNNLTYKNLEFQKHTFTLDAISEKIA